MISRAILGRHFRSSHGDIPIGIVAWKTRCDQSGLRSPFVRTRTRWAEPHLRCMSLTLVTSPARIVQVSRTVLPVAAERRAASRISVTTRLFLSDDSPEGRISPRTTAAK